MFDLDSLPGCRWFSPVLKRKAKDVNVASIGTPADLDAPKGAGGLGATVIQPHPPGGGRGLGANRGRVIPQAVVDRRAIQHTERRWVPYAMYVTDVLALEAALVLGIWSHGALKPVALAMGLEWGGLREGIGMQLAQVMMVLPVAFLAVGMYPGYGRSVVDRLRRRMHTVMIMFAMLIVWDYLMGSQWMVKGQLVRAVPSRGVLLLTFLFVLVLSPLFSSVLGEVLVRLKLWGRPVVVLGAGRTGSLLIRLLNREPELGLVPVAVYDDDPEKWQTPVDGVPVLGPIARAKALPAYQRVPLALIAMPRQNKDWVAKLTNRLPYPRVIVIPDLAGIASLWARTRDLGGVVGLELRRKMIERHNWQLKRVMDFVLAVPILLAVLPVLGFFAAWIKIVSPQGPVFFRQERIGFGGKTLWIWKLRTMHPDAQERLKKTLAADPELQAQWAANCKLKDDPRILPGVGRFLRRSSIDELPQLLNVLTGEMSLVGPRPLPPYHLDKFSPRFRTLRRSVLPGVTGLWQVTDRADSDVELQELLDTYYIRNWSTWLDIHLIIKTIGAVVVGRGAY